MFGSMLALPRGEAVTPEHVSEDSRELYYGVIPFLASEHVTLAMLLWFPGITLWLTRTTG